VPTAWISRRVAANQLDYADEEPRIRNMFADSLARHGMTPRMDEVYQAELRRPAAEGTSARSGGVT